MKINVNLNIPSHTKVMTRRIGFHWKLQLTVVSHVLLHQSSLYIQIRTITGTGTFVVLLVEFVWAELFVDKLAHWPARVSRRFQLLNGSLQ